MKAVKSIMIINGIINGLIAASKLCITCKSIAKMKYSESLVVSVRNIFFAYPYPIIAVEAA